MNTNDRLHPRVWAEIGVLCLLLACCSIGRAATPSARALAIVPSAHTTEIQIVQFMSVQTVTCKALNVLNDLNQYGHVNGTLCTSTGALLDTDDPWIGHVSVNLSFVDGSSFSMAGCTVDDNYTNTEYTSVTVNCIVP
jgi:hypothetical protein